MYAQEDVRALRNDPFVEELEHRTFRWFWETTSPETGLVPDRWPHTTFSSVAAIGFGFTACGIGAERAYVPRDSAALRVVRTLRFLASLPQGAQPSGASGHEGFFYHFLNERTGARFNNEVELSTMDTALLLCGALFCQSYFDRDTPEELTIRQIVDSLYRRVNWRFFLQKPPLLSMAWSPEREFDQAQWKGMNEGMILYLLALGSPTHPIDSASWSAWQSSYVFLPYYGVEFISFGPLFGHQFSHCWIDFRGIRDSFNQEKGFDYFENSRRATYSQRAYATANPRKFRDYSAEIWGLTACDGPGWFTLTIDSVQRRFEGYAARGASVDWTNDDGTIAPAAAAGSVMFAPEISIAALKAMKDLYGTNLYTPYGFRDAFNRTFRTAEHPDGWFDTDYLGIDQGPIVIALENFRSELVWKTMRRNPYIVSGLKRAGFTGGWLDQSK